VEIAGRRMSVESVSDQQNYGIYYDIGRYFFDYRVKHLPGNHDAGHDCLQVVNGRSKMNLEGMLRLNDKTCISSGNRVILGSVKGKVFVDGVQLTAPRADIVMRLDYSYGTLNYSTGFPFEFTKTYTGYEHQMNLKAPSDYRMQYRICESATSCTTPLINARAGGSSDSFLIPQVSATDFSQNVVNMEWYLTQ